MKENYTFPAIFDYSDDGWINISFPDFPGAVTCVEVGEDCVTPAQEVLALAVQECLDTGSKIPNENCLPRVGDQQSVFFINIWMPYHRKRIREVYVKKTLTIPAWLDFLAKESQINFSAVLVEGLKKRLNIE